MRGDINTIYEVQNIGGGRVSIKGNSTGEAHAVSNYSINMTPFSSIIVRGVNMLSKNSYIWLDILNTSKVKVIGTPHTSFWSGETYYTLNLDVRNLQGHHFIKIGGIPTASSSNKLNIFITGIEFVV